MNARRKVPQPPVSQPAMPVMSDTLGALRAARSALPLGEGITLLYRWRHVLERSQVPGTTTLAHDLSDLASLLHAGPVEEVPLQLALIGAQVRLLLPHVPENVRSDLSALADELTRLSRAGTPDSAAP